MSADDIRKVQSQMETIKAKPGVAAAGIALYTRMFSKNIDLVKRFSKIENKGAPFDGSNEELRKQSTNVVSRLADIISALNTPAAEALFFKMAQTHKPRNVTQADYDFVRDCLLEVLGETMGESLEEDAWRNVLDLVAKEVLKHY